MDLKNLITNKAFLFERQEEQSDGDEIIHKILSKEKYEEISEVKYLSTNFNFDTFYAKADNQNLLIKYSFDADSQLLFNEFDFLCSNLSAWKPVGINYSTLKFGDKLAYSIQTFEFAENVEEVGRGIIWENIDNFLSCYFSIQYHGQLPKTTFHDFLQSKLNNFSLDKISEDTVAALKERGQYDKFSDFINLIINDINSIYKPDKISCNEFVHGNLKLSNILHREGLFKFINFTESFKGNSFFDLAALVCCMDLDFDQEKHLFHLFLKNKNENFSIELWQSYKLCYDLYVRILLLDIIFSYLKEVYVLESSRPSKINKLMNAFILNSPRFHKINGIISHAEFLYASILEPLIGNNNQEK